ncbi:hypothetical protein HPB51_020033 [Rhipicephalus microplus]|uniref:Uncharacterized protein n=1 Tax=Rhipicephalus microplus TaxID=6941 RepID=A0A9J6DC94_RHIMP|nr:hypothetical protein HPB51_020033 [Rhipicephalus microplus]
MTAPDSARKLAPPLVGCSERPKTTCRAGTDRHPRFRKHGVAQPPRTWPSCRGPIPARTGCCSTRSAVIAKNESIVQDVAKGGLVATSGRVGARWPPSTAASKAKRVLPPTLTSQGDGAPLLSRRVEQMHLCGHPSVAHRSEGNKRPSPVTRTIAASRVHAPGFAASP